MNRSMKFLTILLALAVLFTAACSDDAKSSNNNGTDAGDTSDSNLSGDQDTTDNTDVTIDSDTVPSGPPRVLFTRPVDDALNVSTNTSINVKFDREMDPATLNTTSFTLMNGAVPITATVDYLGTTATLKPVSPLDNTVTYTATISTDVKDLAGKALENNEVWTFKTMLVQGNGPPAVDLGTAANYVILSKSGISTTGTTTIIGDIAVSPASASYLTGFSLIAPPTTHAKSPIVTGKVFAADYDPPTPTKLTVAILDMEGAFTDAAGRTLPDFTELGAGNIEGMTLVPGLYKWGTGVEVTHGVTLDGGANDIWIFQIGQDLLIGNGAIVKLTGGAQAKNVFWQVDGQVTLGTTSSFQGNILTKTMIEMKTGATLLGRALAQTAITLDATAVTKP